MKIIENSKKIENNIKVVLGDITYPKSESMIIPANLSGLMSKGVPKRVLKAGWAKVGKEAKKALKEQKIDLGGCFSTDSGRLKRRGVKKIYHAVIKKYLNDFTSIHIVKLSLENSFKKVLADKNKSVTICGIGIEPGELDKKVVAISISEICEKYKSKIKIKIIDDNVEFIKQVEEYFKER